MFLLRHSNNLNRIGSFLVTIYKDFHSYLMQNYPAKGNMNANVIIDTCTIHYV